LIPYLLAAGAAAFAWRWRERPSWAFAACAVGVTLGTPDLRTEALAWLLLAFIPFANDPAPWLGRRLLIPAGSRQPQFQLEAHRVGADTPELEALEAGGDAGR
jgi:hypothetical protein